jgi:phosphoribosyl 1,2-cyclic phosphodiesterase
MHLTVHGARGSMAVSDPEYMRYGGNTTCFEVAVDDHRRLLVDCGSGLHRLQQRLPVETGLSFIVLMTHYHWDHILGLPLFPPLWEPGNEFLFVGAAAEGRNAQVCLGEAIRPPWFPVSMLDSPASISYHSADEPFEAWGVRVEPAALHHPQGVMAYRIDGPQNSVVVATDHEAGTGADAALLELARGTDVLIHDSQYTPEEYATRKVGWGHSTWEQATEIAKAAGVRHLVLTSHDPDRTDDEIDAIVEKARERFRDTEGAREGLTLPL